MNTLLNEEIWAVVPAAGQGLRMSSSLPKQYLKLNGVSLLQRTVETLLQVPNIRGVVVSVSPEDTLWSELSISTHEKVKTVIGGATRAESVVAGLQLVNMHASSDTVMVMVHDAARAMTALDDIISLVNKVGQSPENGGLLATKVQDTLKRAALTSNEIKQDHSDEHEHAVVESTVSREHLWQAQTPQMFRAKLLLESLLQNEKAVASGDITDEASAMERSGYSPILVEAVQPNFKITQQRDFDMALALIHASEGANGNESKLTSKTKSS